MKTNNTKATATNTERKDNQPATMPRLREEALYLIALALLLKKESGNASLKQYLEPGGIPGYKNKMAA